MTDTADVTDDAATTAANQAKMSAALLTGVIGGMHRVGLPLLALAVGCGGALEHVGTKLIRSAYRRHGGAGADAVITRLQSMLDDLSRRFAAERESVQWAEKARTN